MLWTTHWLLQARTSFKQDITREKCSMRSLCLFDVNSSTSIRPLVKRHMSEGYKIQTHIYHLYSSRLHLRNIQSPFLFQIDYYLSISHV